MERGAFGHAETALICAEKKIDVDEGHKSVGKILKENQRKSKPFPRSEAPRSH